MSPLPTDGAPPRGAPSRQRYASLLALVMLAGLAARIFYFRLTLGSDDQRWILAGRQLFAERGLDLHAEYYARVVWRFALWLWGLPLGLSLETAAPLMFMLYLVTIWAVASVGRLCFGGLAGLTAASLFASHPINLLYDTRILPDGLGVAMLAVSLLLFARYLRSGRLVELAGAAALTGLTVSVKEYFVLFGVPCLAVLAFRNRPDDRWRAIVTFCVSFVAAMGVDVVLHSIDGWPLDHWVAQSAYGDRLLSREPYRPQTGVRLAATLIAERAFYLEPLFFGSGAAGILILWGVVLLAARARRDAEAGLIVGTVALFLTFLSVMPARLRPLVFVEMQERYLTVLLPFAAVAAGAGVAAVLDVMREVRDRRAASAVLALALFYSIVVADAGWDRYRAVELAGIRRVLATSDRRGISEIVLPEVYERLTPDRYYGYGPRLRFMPFNSADAVEPLRRYLRGDRSRVVFVPASGTTEWPAVTRLSPGDNVAPDNALAVASDGAEATLVQEEVTAPYTAWRSWLAAAGIETRGRTVGWLYRARA